MKDNDIIDVSSTYFKDEESFLSKLKELTGLGYYNGARTEIICRCPFEGCELELGKNYSYGRLYIDRENPVFHCFRCQNSGSIIKLFRKLNINPYEYIKQEVVTELTSSVYQVRNLFHHKDVSVYARKIFLEKNKLNLKINIPQSEIYEKKKRYLRNRIGPDTIVENIPNLVLNIAGFFYDNHIELTDYDRDLLPYYEKECIGFVGNRGLVLILRSFEGQYHKISLVKKPSSTVTAADTLCGEREHQGGRVPVFYYKDFYGVYINSPNESSLVSSGDVSNSSVGCGLHNGSVNKVLLTEGVFDLLVGLKHLSDSSVVKECCFAAAALGSYYSETLFSVLDYIRLSYVDLVILSDRDKPLDSIEYKKLKESPFVRTLEIYYNKVGHDFGDYPIIPSRNVFLNTAIGNTFSTRKKNKNKSFR